MNTALMSAQATRSLAELRGDREAWGRWVESAVGAHLANAAATGAGELSYWREANREVDFVMRAGHHLVAIEVKSGRSHRPRSGSAAFRDAFGATRPLLVGDDGIALADFLATPVERWLG